ncbi:MAG: hypothetical protein EP330_09595 [Deltaproteobacteria bacterium]|nr:MAG: hypothetical protein EP330_09595 [Deltaproteobacteria bacterium]
MAKVYSFPGSRGPAPVRRTRSSAEPAELVDLNQALTADRGKALVETLTETIAELQLDGPEAYGWRVLRRDEEGRPIRWYLVKYQAMIGYIQGAPDHVFLDFRNKCCAYELSIEELAARITAGLLPDPAYEIE